MSERGRRQVLVVDDSAFMRKLISDILNQHPEMEVVATARNGKDAIEKIEQVKPDVVTMDIEMPIMDGLEALKKIMDTAPVPVVMLSSTTKKGAENTVLAMEMGAVDFIAKPGGAISLNLQDIEQEIVEKVYEASKVKMDFIVRKDNSLLSRRTMKPIVNTTITSFPEQKGASFGYGNRKDEVKIISKKGKPFVIIGTSTGGPRALQEVLTRLPASIAAPILIVQHMPAGFTKSLADRLNSICDITVKEAEDGDRLENGTAYLAPGGKHLKIVKIGTAHCVRLDAFEDPRMGHRPAVDVLLESAALLTDAHFITVIMTGMGNDGQKGMTVLRQNNNTYTIAESANTAVIYGMPKAIEEAGLADEVVDLNEIPEKIMDVLKA